MSTLAINLWPRWLRILIVGAATAAAIGSRWFAYRYFAKPVVLTVAAGSADGADLGDIGAPVGVELACPAEGQRCRKFGEGGGGQGRSCNRSGRYQRPGRRAERSAPDPWGWKLMTAKRSWPIFRARLGREAEEQYLRQRHRQRMATGPTIRSVNAVSRAAVSLSSDSGY